MLTECFISKNVLILDDVPEVTGNLYSELRVSLGMSGNPVYDIAEAKKGDKQIDKAL
jgi:hypothetical protein